MLSSSAARLLQLRIAGHTAPVNAGRHPACRLSQENFSIAVPATWNEIEPAVLAGMPAAIRQAAPNAPEIKIKHGFKTSATEVPSYPWVAIILTGDRVDEAMFEKMDWAIRSVDELTKKWQASGGTLGKAQMNSM